MKFFIRVVALLLVPCLIADASFAAALGQERPWAVRPSAANLFQEQAMASAFVNFTRPRLSHAAVGFAALGGILAAQIGVEEARPKYNSDAHSSKSSSPESPILGTPLLAVALHRRKKALPAGPSQPDPRLLEWHQQLKKLLRKERSLYNYSAKRTGAEEGSVLVDFILTLQELDQQSAGIAYPRLIASIVKAMPSSLHRREMLQNIQTFTYNLRVGLSYEDFLMRLQPTAHQVLVAMTTYLLATRGLSDSNRKQLKKTIRLYNAQADRILMPLNEASLFADAAVLYYHHHPDFATITSAIETVPGDAGILLQALLNLLNAVHLENYGGAQLADKDNLLAWTRNLVAYIKAPIKRRSAITYIKATIGLIRGLLFLVPWLAWREGLPVKGLHLRAGAHAAVGEKTRQGLLDLIAENKDFHREIALLYIPPVPDALDLVWAGWTIGAPDYDFLSRQFLDWYNQMRVHHVYFESGIFEYGKPYDGRMNPDGLIDVCRRLNAFGYDIKNLMTDKLMIKMMSKMEGPLIAQFGGPLDSLLLDPLWFGEKWIPNMRTTLTELGFYSEKAAARRIAEFWAAFDALTRPGPRGGPAGPGSPKKRRAASRRGLETAG